MTITVPLLTSINGGLPIPDDWQNWQIKKFRDIRAIEGSNQFDRFAAVEVSGDSLKPLNILNDDVLIFKITTQYEEGKIGIWQTPSGRTAKFAYQDFDGSVVLHNENGWQQRWEAADLQLIGVVIRVERDV
jgi:SOS-response transcriptional repressor LexA